MSKWQSKFSREKGQKTHGNTATDVNDPQTHIDTRGRSPQSALGNTTATRLPGIVAVSPWVAEEGSRQPESPSDKALKGVAVLPCDFQVLKEIKDDRTSCWWCDYWSRFGSCVNVQIGKTYAVANGTLQRCPGFRRRISPIPDDVGFCEVCGCHVQTTDDAWVVKGKFLHLYCAKHRMPNS